MLRRSLTLIILGIFLIGASGCIALLVGGAAGGAGTAMWLSGKLSQDVNAPYERVITASKSALNSLKLAIARETREENVTQIRSDYYDTKEIWIDIKKLTEQSTRIEVRVGTVTPDKEAATKIMDKIKRYL